MRRLFLIVACFPVLALSAQSYIDFGDDVKLRIASNGIFSINQDDLNPASPYKQGSNHFLAQMGIWISAYDQDDDLHTSVQMLKTKDNYDFSYGPLDTIGSQPDTSGWNKVWSVSAATVKNHRTKYKEPGYLVPQEIASWPAENQGGNFVRYLAPFVDINANSVYDPESGDYPYIKGDEAVYVICNDNSFEHKVSGGIPLGLEVHIMIYKYNSLPNRLFFEYYLINRLDFDYHNVRVGLFMDGICGNPLDNFAGTRVNENTVFIYNGDDDDEGGFAAQLPFVYARFLNHELASSVLFSNGKDSLIGLPDKSVEFDNYLSGKWRNGSMRQYGNQGITASFDYPYMYPSASDEDVDEWSEESVANSPGRRQILAVIETKDLAQGNYIKFDYVIGFGFVESQSALSLVLNKSSTEARDQYFNFSSLEPELTKNVLIYPNPSTGRFMIRGISAGLYEIYVTDIQGVRLIGEQIQVLGDYECNFYLSSGVYTVELIGSSGIITKTLIIQP